MLFALPDQRECTFFVLIALFYIIYEGKPETNFGPFAELLQLCLFSERAGEA
jgi:hypothetical protein